MVRCNFSDDAPLPGESESNSYRASCYLRPSTVQQGTIFQRVDMIIVLTAHAPFRNDHDRSAYDSYDEHLADRQPGGAQSLGKRQLALRTFASCIGNIHEG
jgi:hypothetical protein